MAVRILGFLASLRRDTGDAVLNSCFRRNRSHLSGIYGAFRCFTFLHSKPQTCVLVVLEQLIWLFSQPTDYRLMHDSDQPLVRGLGHKNSRM